ncbi:MAG TPA: SDR family oxidoreductase [Caulobacteraceae bacterium]|jgi:NAD(P)-dependent dehydrogenase (short-subunit alcohol dehydrogenase family)
MWSLADMPPQKGRRAIVTGTGGLGYETAVALVAAGAHVVIAGRSPRKGREAVVHILNNHPGSNVVFEQVDLANLASVAGFCDRILAAGDPVDLLVNNAGVMAPPKRQTTTDGFELQFGTNHLGHFAVTGRLLPLLQLSTAPRVTTVSSGAHHSGRIDFDNLQWTKGYSAWPAYAQSKLANLLFAFELQRRSDVGGWGLVSNAAHPGYSRTELIANGPGLDSVMSRLSRIVQPLISQDAAKGALPQLFAATSPDAGPATYWGPSGFFELIGPPSAAKVSDAAKDTAVAKHLWDVSEALTGVKFGAA